MKIEKKLTEKQKQKIGLIIESELKNSRAKTIKIEKNIYINLICNTLSDEDYLKILHGLNASKFEMVLTLLDIQLLD